MSYWVFLLTILINPAYSSQEEDCRALPGDALFKNINFMISGLSKSSFDKNSACKKLVEAKTKDQLIQALQALSLRQNVLLKDKPGDRHSVGVALNDCVPEKDSKALVISFSGTGSYDPRVEHLMTYGFSCLGDSKRLDPSLIKYYYSAVLGALENKGRKSKKWSAIDKGIMPLFLSDKTLSKNADKLDFATFPSEESEIIADPENIGMDQIMALSEEVDRSSAGLPKGVSHAVQCVSRYLRASKKLNIKPKIIILSHSSGARSAVKFHEAMKWVTNPLTGKKDFKSDLVFSIDPVIEAHEVMKEVASQYAGKAVDAVNPFSDKSPEVKVWTRDHSKRLYKPNNSRSWYSVYQTEDTNGIGMKDLPFGIQGSKVKNADKNLYLSDFKKDKKSQNVSAHGDIGDREETKSLFLKQVHLLIGD